jgi:hypothetical protein
VPRTSYQPLSANEEAATTVHTTPGRPSSPLLFARPATYYGDGPFDPASSESSDEEEDESSLLLEKKLAPSSPGMAELGDGFSGMGLRDDNNTKVSLMSWQ